MRILMTLMLVVVLVSGCNKEDLKLQAAEQLLPAGLFVTSPPSGAVDVVAARTTAKDGDEIVIKGQVAGAKEPLAANRAIMTIADLSLPTCDKTPNDTCKTPWDACCEPTDDIARKSLSVQVVGPDGRPIKAGLGGNSGLAPLKQVVVAGTVKIPSGSTAPVIEAKRIYVVSN